MKRYLCFILFVTFCLSASSYDERNLLQQKAAIEQLKKDLILHQKWVPYPAYNDRQGWDKLFGSRRNVIVKRGEKQSKYVWKRVKASDYLEYERSGERKIMENPFNENVRATVELALAELAEGKGRFIEPLMNNVFSLCETNSWAISAHLVRQKSRRAIPDYKENIIELVSSDVGAFLSWVHYFFKPEFDKIDPVVSEQLSYEIRRRILDPYMNDDSNWWMAFRLKPGDIVNNWNPWCNSNVLQAFLLMENDPDKLALAVYRTMQSVDKFINYTHSDGACEEGPSYWGHAAGKLYDYLQLLYEATDGKLSLFEEPQIKKMGEFISRTYVGNGWVVNFADASAQGGGDPILIYRYGKSVKSAEMMSYAATMFKSDEIDTTEPKGRDFYRILEEISFADELRLVKPEHKTPAITWYPETEFCYIKNDNFFLAAKGGYNSESHNHNDAGTFTLYYKQTPFLIDAGVGTYTRQTFSKDRYSIWTMQSNYHNLPMINNVPQQFGSEYKASNVRVDEKKKQFSADIAGAYPAEAGVKSWVRSYLLKSNELQITDKFSLVKTLDYNRINFLTWGKVDISTPGAVSLEVDGKKMELLYDKNEFTPSVETIKLPDVRLSKVWGKEMYRITLTAKKMESTGTYTYRVVKK